VWLLLERNDIPRRRLLINVFGETARCVFEIGLADDVVAVEDGSSLVAGDAHRYPLRDACADQVPDDRATQVVKEFSWQAGRFARPLPRLAPVADWPFILLKNERTAQGSEPPPALDHRPEWL
jgi:hypothetical protein